MTTNSLIAPPEARGQRLDKFMKSIMKDNFSRTFIQQSIESGSITVNGKKVPTHFFLKSGEIITWTISKAPIKPHLKPNKSVPYKIICQTSDYVVVDKPAGIVVHPAPGVTEPTLIESLITQFSQLKTIGENSLRPGIVHRLDKEVSGLLVVALTNDMFEHLKQQFAKRSVKKEYLGLVLGKVSQPSGTIKFPLARSKRNHGKIAARKLGDQEAREAITHYVVEKEYQQCTLLKINLETGRTHQIRAHLAALGYPLVGDKLYRPAKINFKNNPGRIFLHSYQLSFIDLEGTKKTFTSSLPAELNNFLSLLS